MYCRINLTKTNYEEIDYRILTVDSFDSVNSIYKTYCDYKKFTSVEPLFKEDFSRGEVIGYYDNSALVAFSLIFDYKSANSVFAEQFAWDYKNPKLRLGIRSLQSECARYKKLGYDYLYLGEADDYKKKFDGFEII